jgi:hypothetical protein
MMHLQTNVNFTGVQSNTPLLYIAWEFGLMADWHWAQGAMSCCVHIKWIIK